MPPEPPLPWMPPLGVPATLAPRLLVNGLASHGDRTLPFVAEGVDPAVDLRDDRALRLVAGRRLAPATTGSCCSAAGSRSAWARPWAAAWCCSPTPRTASSRRWRRRWSGCSVPSAKSWTTRRWSCPWGWPGSCCRSPGAHSWRVFLEDTADTSGHWPAARAPLPGRRWRCSPGRRSPNSTPRGGPVRPAARPAQGIVVGILLLLASAIPCS